MIKTMTVDNFYTQEQATNLTMVVWDLNKEKSEFGMEIPNFNMVPAKADALFSKVLNKKVKVIDERSGIFRFPELFIHFESFDSPKEWLFVTALQHSTFNLYEHQSGVVNALQDYKFNYRNLFEWNLTVNYQLSPGQGIFFRPWLFHSFDSGLIQIFRLLEK